MGILRRGATAKDLQRVVGGLEHAYAEEDWYPACDALETLERIRVGIPPEIVEAAYREAPFSRVCSYACRVLVAAHRERFSRGFAVEVLWDCEAETRAIGAKCADLSCEGASARLSTLILDERQDEGVRDAALSRGLDR